MPVSSPLQSEVESSYRDPHLGQKLFPPEVAMQRVVWQVIDRNVVQGRICNIRVLLAFIWCHDLWFTVLVKVSEEHADI